MFLGGAAFAEGATIAEDADLLDGLVPYWPLDKEGGVRADTIGDNDLHDVNGVSSGVGVVGNSHNMMQLDAFYYLGD